MEMVCKDALEYIDSFNDNSFDLIFLDPDYQNWDHLLKEQILEKAIKKLKPTGNLLCFTKQPFDYNLRVAANPYFRREIVWTFENGGAWCSPKMPLISSQKIYWLVKSKDFYFNPRTGIEYSEKTKNFTRQKKCSEIMRQKEDNFKRVRQAFG
jgi:ubiquinone/menaquinone biosynthesis C-methylase UbiE